MLRGNELKNLLRSKVLKFACFVVLIFFAFAVCEFINPEANIIYNALTFTAYPFNKSFAYLSGKISDFNHQFEEKEKLQNEIESLKSELSELRNKLIDYSEVKRENAQFAKYYEFKKENDSLKFVPASVIGRDISDLFLNFTIDKGKDSGISKDDIVITENGVVGVVYIAGGVCSKVRSILSPDCKIGVFGIDNSGSGVIIGRAEEAEKNLTRMMFVQDQNSLKPGEIVATAGISGMYPKNLKLGRVKSLDYDDKESSYYAKIEPFENLKDTKDVFVITDFRGKGAILND